MVGLLGTPGRVGNRVDRGMVFHWSMALETEGKEGSKTEHFHGFGLLKLSGRKIIELTKVCEGILIVLSSQDAREVRGRVD